MYAGTDLPEGLSLAAGWGRCMCNAAPCTVWLRIVTRGKSHLRNLKSSQDAADACMQRLCTPWIAGCARPASRLLRCGQMSCACASCWALVRLVTPGHALPSGWAPRPAAAYPPRLPRHEQRYPPHAGADGGRRGPPTFTSRYDGRYRGVALRWTWLRWSPDCPRICLARL